MPRHESGNDKCLTFPQTESWHHFFTNVEIINVSIMLLLDRILKISIEVYERRKFAQWIFYWKSINNSHIVAHVIDDVDLNVFNSSSKVELRREEKNWFIQFYGWYFISLDYNIWQILNRSCCWLFHTESITLI